MKTMKVNFFLDITRENSEGKSPVRVRSRHNSDKLIFRSTGIFSSSSEWLKKKGTSKNTHTFNLLSNLEGRIKESYDELIKNLPEATLADVWDRLFPVDGHNGDVPKSKKVVDWVDYYLKHSPNSKDYVRGVKLLKVHLAGESKKGKVKPFNPVLRFDELNQTTVNAFAAHMAGQGKSTGTIIKAVKFLKQLAKIALDHRLKVGSTDFKAPRNFLNKAKTEIRLSMVDILKIRDFIPDKKTVEAARDIFVLQCFTGLRFSDVMRITVDHIHSDFIEIKQQKTGDTVLVTINQFSKQLLLKYAKSKNGVELILPQHKQQFVNREIKLIAKAAGLKEIIKVTKYHGAKIVEEDVARYKLVGSHTGRRSFSRIMAILGVSEKIISEEMGHKVGSITQHYIGTSEHRERIKTVQEAWRNADQLKDLKLMIA